jgi:putative oxidoreductase
VLHNISAPVRRSLRALSSVGCFFGAGGKLNNLPAMIENFASWHIPAPHVLTPFVSGVEFFGGIFLLLGLLTRVSAGALGITMIVAIASAKWDQVDSLETLLGFDETEYLALFLWLAIAGAGRFSIDRLLNRSLRATVALGSLGLGTQ